MRLRIGLRAECVDCGARRELGKLKGAGERRIIKAPTGSGRVLVVRVTEQSACKCGGRRVMIRLELR